MPTTPNYGFPFPSLSDPPNVPADMEALAEGVDSALDRVQRDTVLGVTDGEYAGRDYRLAWDSRTWVLDANSRITLDLSRSGYFDTAIIWAHAIRTGEEPVDISMKNATPSACLFEVFGSDGRTLPNTDLGVLRMMYLGLVAGT